MAHRLGTLACHSDSEGTSHLSFRSILGIQGGTSFWCLDGPRYALSLKSRGTDAEGFVKGVERECDFLDKFSLKKWAILLLVLTLHDLSPTSFRVVAQGSRGATLEDAIITCARLSVIQEDPLFSLDDPCIQRVLSGQAQQPLTQLIPTSTIGLPVLTATPAVRETPKPTKKPKTTPSPVKTPATPPTIQPVPLTTKVGTSSMTPAPLSSTPVPPTTKIPTSSMTHAPSSSTTACFTANNTTGSPFAPAKCPPGSCVSSLQTQTGAYHFPAFDQDALIPIFYSINITCTDVSTGLATSQLVKGYGTNGTNVFINPGFEVLNEPNGCLTGIGANVSFPSSQAGSAVYFVSTLYLLVNTSHLVGYYPGQGPFTNYSSSRLGALACEPGTYITEIYGRSGSIMDDPCFTCSAVGTSMSASPG